MLTAVMGVLVLSLGWNIQADDLTDDPILEYSDSGEVLGEAPEETLAAPEATVTGQVLRIQDFGCGTYVAVTTCPIVGNLPNCNDVPGGGICEGDGECGTDGNLNNCGAFDVYIRSAW
jgi:hypothetical protein